MGPLTDILQDLRLKSSFYCRSDVCAPWGLAFSIQDGPAFHIFLVGQGYLRMDSQNTSLQAGDVVLLPHSVAHDLVSGTKNLAVPIEKLSSTHVGDNAAFLTLEGDGDRSLLICGRVRFAGLVEHPLIALLPKMLILHTAHKQDTGQEDEWLGSTLRMLAEEAYSLRPGSMAVMKRLADILVLQTIRAWLDGNANQQEGWLAALRDPEIGKVLVSIHQQAEYRWTVNSLAAQAHLSRSVFSERFSRLVGMAPMQYVTHWKMHLASNWIEEDRLSLREVTHRLGYSSEAAFSRAFRRYMQLPPGSIHRNASL
jgi:AraC-like DNA-binding protein